MKKTKSGVDEGRGGSSPSQRIDARIKELSDWWGETLAQVRLLIEQAAPEVVEETKWRKPSNSMLGFRRDRPAPVASSNAGVFDRLAVSLPDKASAFP